MKIGVLGTGEVGRIISKKLAGIGHDVMLGTRDVNRTRAKVDSDGYPFKEWLDANAAIHLGTFAQSAQWGEVVINATSGEKSILALESAGEANLNGKILIDISNPLDFSKGRPGRPPSLFVSNTDSLGEQIQARFPLVKVVKTLNTVWATLMVNPSALADGDHHLFVSGNDADAKNAVVDYLKTWFGWKHIIDLGDITTARGTEMMLPVWIRLWGALGSPMFNFKIVR